MTVEKHLAAWKHHITNMVQHDALREYSDHKGKEKVLHNRLAKRHETKALQHEAALKKLGVSVPKIVDGRDAPRGAKSSSSHFVVDHDPATHSTFKPHEHDSLLKKPRLKKSISLAKNTIELLRK